MWRIILRGKTIVISLRGCLHYKINIAIAFNPNTHYFWFVLLANIRFEVSDIHRGHSQLPNQVQGVVSSPVNSIGIGRVSDVINCQQHRRLARMAPQVSDANVARDRCQSNDCRSVLCHLCRSHWSVGPDQHLFAPILF